MRKHLGSSRRVISFGMGLWLLSCVAIASPSSQARFVRIETQPLETALTSWARQTGYSVLFPIAATPDGLTMRKEVVGTYTAEAALQSLLAGSELKYEFVNARTVAISASDSRRIESSGDREETKRTQAAESVAPEEVAGGSSTEDGVAHTSSNSPMKPNLPEVLISGSRSLNSDIRRTEDDAQPYVVIGREAIEHSGAANLDSLLRSQLTMVTSAVANAQTGNDARGTPLTSKINLRGLGSDETLILIDGRRVGGSGSSSAPAQPDLNTIPLAAVDRIEVLPATASGIYGGGATGGVINVILRHDYHGLETKLSYGGAFAGGATARRVDIAGGFNLQGGKTNVTFLGSWFETADLLTGDREFSRRAREMVLSNNPNSIYGAATPPAGATTNIRSANGSPLTLKANGASLGSSFTYVPYGYAGPASDGGAALLTNAGKYNLDPPNTSQRATAAIGSEGLQYPLLSSPTIKSLMTTIHHSFTPWLEGFAEFSASENEALSTATFPLGSLTIPATAPGNPFNQTINVLTPTVGVENETHVSLQNRRGTVGLVSKLSNSWNVGVDYVWDRTRSPAESYLNESPNTAGAASAVASGSLNVFRDTNVFPTDLSHFILPPWSQTAANTTLQDLALRVSGNLPAWLPAGSPSTSFLAEHRRGDISDLYVSRAFVGSTQTVLVPSAWQSVDSIYLEMLLPLVAKDQSVPGVNALELQVAGRYDRYQTRASTATVVDQKLAPTQPLLYSTNRLSSTNPTLALRYLPARDLTLRASYGTGFLPPDMSQIGGSAPTVVSTFANVGIVDPLRGNERLSSSILATSGGNGNLHPEESTSRSAGFILTPRVLGGLRLSVDWVDIKKDDNIAFISALTQSGFNTYIQFLPERITRGSASGGFQVGPVTGIDQSFVNLAKLHVESLDFAADYDWRTSRWGSFDLHLGGTRVMSLETQVTASSPLVEFAGVGSVGNIGGNTLDGGALKWSASGSLTWRFRGVTLGWTARFFDSYLVYSPSDSTAIVATRIANQGSDHIPSQIYHDLFGSYDLSSVGSGSSLLQGLEIQFRANNVLNKTPPIDVVGRGSLPPGYSYFGDPRLATYSLTISKSFGGGNRS